MPPVVAIELNTSNARLISGEMTATGTIMFRGSKTIDVLPEFSSFDQDSNDAEIPNDSDELISSTTLSGLVDEDSFSTIFAVTDSNFILHERHNLPFNDHKKIEQVAPLQIQDLVPFDIDQFLMNNIVLGPSPDGSYQILSSLMPQVEVDKALKRLDLAGAEPHIITTKASALLGLTNLFPDQLSGTFGIVAASHKCISLILVVDDILEHISDITILTINNKPDIEAAAWNILCAIKRIERDCKIDFTSLYCTGANEILLQVFEILGINPIKLNLEAVVENEGILGESLDDLSWALGLIASEGDSSTNNRFKFVDFRKGPFAYRPTFGNFISAVREEAIYFIFAILSIVGYFSAQIYVETSELAKIDKEIESQFIQALGSPPPAGQNEVTYLMTKIAETSDQLREVGSLSTMSPLNLIKELSSKIGQDLEIEINLMNISQEEVTFEGIVPNNPAVGRLDKSLNAMNNLFCEIEVSPMGQQPGRGVRVRTKLKLCS